MLACELKKNVDAQFIRQNVLDEFVEKIEEHYLNSEWITIDDNSLVVTPAQNVYMQQHNITATKFTNDKNPSNHIKWIRIDIKYGIKK